MKVKSLNRVRLLVTPWTATNQAPPSMGFSRQEYWSGVHCLLHIKSLEAHISEETTVDLGQECAEVNYPDETDDNDSS